MNKKLLFLKNPVALIGGAAVLAIAAVGTTAVTAMKKITEGAQRRGVSFHLFGTQKITAASVVDLDPCKGIGLSAGTEAIEEPKDDGKKKKPEIPSVNPKKVTKGHIQSAKGTKNKAGNKKK